MIKGFVFNNLKFLKFFYFPCVVIVLSLFHSHSSYQWISKKVLSKSYRNDIIHENLITVLVHLNTFNVHVFKSSNNLLVGYFDFFFIFKKLG